MGCAMTSILVEAYRRGMLSFLQYVAQTSPYAGANDRPILDRLRELAKVEVEQLAALAEYLDRQRVTLPYLGAFPTSFTNYNFVAVRKLLPQLVADESKGLTALEHDVAAQPDGEGREWLEKLAAAKRLHLGELQKLVG